MSYTHRKAGRVYIGSGGSVTIRVELMWKVQRKQRPCFLNTWDFRWSLLNLAVHDSKKAVTNCALQTWLFSESWVLHKKCLAIFLGFSLHRISNMSDINYSTALQYCIAPVFAVCVYLCLKQEPFMPYLKVLHTSVHCAVHLWGQPQSSFVI